MVECWRGCLSGASCRLVYGPADATATHCLSKIQIGFIFLVPAHPGSPGKRAVNGCLCVCVIPVASENDSRVMVAWSVFSFRVVTYNILADIYADSDFSRDYLFCHCPADVLSMDYRKQLLLKELIGVYTIDLAS